MNKLFAIFLVTLLSTSAFAGYGGYNSSAATSQELETFMDDSGFDTFPRTLDGNIESAIATYGLTGASRQMFVDVTDILTNGTPSDVDIQDLEVLNPDITLTATTVYDDAVKLRVWDGGYTYYGYYADDGTNYWMADGFGWTIPALATPASVTIPATNSIPPAIAEGSGDYEALIYPTMANFEVTWLAPTTNWIAKNENTFPELATVTNSTRTLIRNVTSFRPIAAVTANSLWNSRYKNKYNITLITQKHAVGAWHVVLSTNDTVTFVGLNNQTWSTTITDVTRIGSTALDDIVVYQLADSHPDYISHMDIAVNYWAEDVASRNYANLPMVYIDQMKTLQPFYTAYRTGYMIDSATLDGAYGVINGLDASAVAGDSGSPAFLTVIGKGYLSFSVEKATTGDFLPDSFDDIQAAITAFGDTNIVEQFDVTPYLSVANSKADKFYSPNGTNVYLDVVYTNGLYQAILVTE